MKILYVTTISNTMSFFVEHIKMLYNEGHVVEIACAEGTKPLNPIYHELGCKVHIIPFSRSPFSKSNLKAYKMLKHLVEAEHYDIVHTHTPNASMLARLACHKLRKKGTRVFYTAHGFHFFKGAPLKNWLIYYPIEKLCARFTDVLITINKEDYALAQKKMHAKKICYVPGVGIDLSKIQNIECNRDELRKSMGVPEDCILLLSIGELNINKNHQVAVKALAKLNNKNVHYAIAGIGDQKANLLALAKNLGVDDQIHLLGYRTDALKLYSACDVFVFPSLREGLSVSLMEAMASGLPIICSNIRGNIDLVKKSIAHFSPNNANELQQKIDIYINNPSLREELTNDNKQHIQFFSLKNVLKKMNEIYGIQHHMINNDTLKKIHDIEIEILEYVHNFCIKHNIKYSLYCGTMLGAIRHKGFIPWDDDIDICMERLEYERFLQLWNNSNNFILQNKKTDSDFTQSFTKIRKNNTTFLQANEEETSYHKGIFIDILPLDRIPNGCINRLFYKINVMKYQLFVREFVPKGSNIIIQILCRLLLKINKGNKRVDKREKNLKSITKYKKENNLCLISANTMDGFNHIMPAHMADNIIPYYFEGKTFNGYADYEGMLKAWYKNYMQLPPIEDRVWKHKPQLVDFQKNYRE